MTDQQPAKKGRGRPKGSANKSKGDTVPAADRKVHADHNNMPQVAKEPLSEDQQQALFFNHKKAYEKELEAKKKADASFKVACKLIKAEGTKLSDVKLAIDLEDPEAGAEMRARIERELKVARWMNVPVGTQFSLLDETDRTPIDEKTYNDGKKAGLSGEPAKPPNHTPPSLFNKWLDGHAAGQAALASKFKQKNDDQRAEDARAFDDEPPSTTH